MQFNLNSYAILWSPHQDTVHSQTVAEMLRENKANFENHKLGDFIVMGFEETEEAATKACDHLIAMRDG